MANPFKREGKKKKKQIKVIYKNIITGIEELEDIRNICYEDWLYEYEKEGKKVDINLIENQFSKLEDIWSKIIDKIEKEETLSDKEVVFLKILIIKQLTRTPGSMSITQEIIQSLAPNLSKEEVDRYCKISMFAIGKDIKVEAQWAFSLACSNRK